MATPFIRSIRYLQADGFNQSVQTLMRALLVLLVWSLWFLCTRVDVVVVARGALRPERADIPVMPSMEARVVDVRIHDGDRVTAGQVLYVLESRVAAADEAGVARQAAALQQAQHDAVTQLPLEESRLADDRQAESRRLETLQNQVQQLATERASRQHEHDVAVAAQEMERSRRQEHTHQVQLDLWQAERNEKTDKQILDLNRGLLQQGFVSKLAVLDLENRFDAAHTDAEKGKVELRVATSSVREIDTVIAGLDASLATTLSDVARRAQDVQAQLADCTAHLAQADKDATLLRQKAEESVQAAHAEYQKTLAQAQPGLAEEGPQTLRSTRQSGRFEVVAPVTGRVATLAVKEAGTFVSSGTVMVRLLPEDSPLLFEALVANRDMGELHTGVSARVRLDAYPSEHFGSVLGRVTWVAPDAEMDPQLGAVYRIRCRIDEHPDAIPLATGLTGSVEMVCGRRRIVDMALQDLRELGEHH